MQKPDQPRRLMPNGDRLTNHIQTLDPQDIRRDRGTDAGGLALPDRVTTTPSAVVVRQDGPAGPTYQEALGYALNITGSWVPGLTQMDDGTLVLTVTIYATASQHGVILFSSDDGLSWSPPRPAPATRCTPVNLGGDRLLLHSDEDGLHSSDDRGQTWSGPRPAPPGLATDVAMNPLVEGDDLWWIFMRPGGARDWNAHSVLVRYDLKEFAWDEPVPFPTGAGAAPGACTAPSRGACRAAGSSRH